MGNKREPLPVKLIAGFIFKYDSAFDKAKLTLEKKFGKIDFQSRIIEFNYTDYYEKEFGSPLKRKFVSFKKLIPPESLAEIKNITNKIEKRLSKKSLRQVNIDPGYIELSKLVLASTKDYVHRIYLGRGIHAEITLFFQNHTFRPWEYTYRDYKTEEYISVFNQIREIYEKQAKNF